MPLSVSLASFIKRNSDGTKNSFSCLPIGSVCAYIEWSSIQWRVPLSPFHCDSDLGKYITPKMFCAAMAGAVHARNVQHMAQKLPGFCLADVLGIASSEGKKCECHFPHLSLLLANCCLWNGQLLRTSENFRWNPSQQILQIWNASTAEAKQLRPPLLAYQFKPPPGKSRQK